MIFQIWPQAVTKALPGLPLGEGCPPHTRLGAQPMRCGLWRELLPWTQAPLAGHDLHTSTFLGLFYLRPWAEVLKRLCPTLSTQYFYPPSSPASSSPGYKTAGTFCSVLCQQWDDPHTCADPPNPGWVHRCGVLFRGGRWNGAIGIFSSFSLLLRP